MLMHKTSIRVLCVYIYIYIYTTIKFDVVGAPAASKYIQISWTDLQRVEKLHQLKSKPVFSKLPKKKGA